MLKVERLNINYKTLEEFKRFKEYGLQELSMLGDLQDNIIENDAESPFYGIYIGNKLVARMSLYQVSKQFDRFFDPTQDYLEIWKLEVIPDYQYKGFGTMLVDYAKSFGLPLKTNARMQSQGFWERQGFHPAEYDVARDLGTNPLIWFPYEIKERTQ
jgi:GNAT superfamily N-acetyltransferase